MFFAYVATAFSGSVWWINIFLFLRRVLFHGTDTPFNPKLRAWRYWPLLPVTQSDDKQVRALNSLGRLGLVPGWHRSHGPSSHLAPDLRAEQITTMREDLAQPHRASCVWHCQLVGLTQQYLSVTCGQLRDRFTRLGIRRAPADGLASPAARSRRLIFGCSMRQRDRAGC